MAEQKAKVGFINSHDLKKHTVVDDVDTAVFKYRDWKPIIGSHHLPAHNAGAGTIPPTPRTHETDVNKSSNNHSTIGETNTCPIREQDRFMPIANVIRIMRKVLPTHAKISDDAKETIQECVSEYISFITSEANDRCRREQRKTITADDLLFAMSKLGFDDYIHPLSLYLRRYRELDPDRRGSANFNRHSPPSGNNNGNYAVSAAAGIYGFGPAPAVSYISPAAMQHHQYAGVVDEGVGGYYLGDAMAPESTPAVVGSYADHYGAYR